MNKPQAMPVERHRPIRSFVRREGRLTHGQARALDECWPRYGINPPAQPQHPAQWFGNPQPLTLEIGFGNGDYLLHRCAAELQRNFIGVEVHRPGVGRLLDRAAAAELNNLRVICWDAVEVLRDWLVADCLDELLIQFPDPWHKKRHHKRRLVQPAFVRLLCERLRIGGRLRLATDWQNYAEQMLAVLGAEAALRNRQADGGYAPRPDDRPVTRFEQRGERLGHAVFDLDFERIS